VNKKQEDCGVPLPHLPTTWHDLCTEGLLLLCLVVSSFTCTIKPVANFVGAANLTCDCSCSLLTALAENHPDQEVCLQSYFGEKCGIESIGTYDKLSLAEYRALQEKGAPRAIPTMCVLTIKPDKMFNPFHAKFWIVILGNHEDCIWSKSEWYAPVLRSNTKCRAHG
jgi:hypothetical protein